MERASSPLYTLRSGLVMQQPQSPYRLATPAPVTSVIILPTTSTVSTSAPSIVTTASVIAATSTDGTNGTSVVNNAATSAAETAGTSNATPTVLLSSVLPTLGHIFVDPGLPGPGSFFGDDSQDPRDWWNTFQSWSNIKHFTERTQLDVFPMLMKVTALRWYNTMPTSDKQTLTDLKTAFFDRFETSDVWSDFVKIGQLKQTPSEPVVVYLERSLTLLNRVKLAEQHQISAIIEGLKPQIQSFVIQQKVVNFPQLKEAAILAEKSFRQATSDDVLTAVKHLEDTFKSVTTAQPPAPPALTAINHAPAASNDFPKRHQQNWTQPNRIRGSSTVNPSRSARFQPSNAQNFQSPQQHPTWRPRNEFHPNANGETITCYRCLQPHPSYNCRFRQSKCFCCSKIGHIQVACRSRLSANSSQ